MKGQYNENLIFLLLTTQIILADPAPEFYFRFDGANHGRTYKITAEKFGIDPLYIWATNVAPNHYIKTSDTHWTNPPALVATMPLYGYVGWDLQGTTNWLDDPPGSGRPDLGRGRYLIKLLDISNNNDMLFSFILDTRYTPLTSIDNMDISFIFYFDNEILNNVVYEPGTDPLQLNNNDEIKFWEAKGYNFDWSGFITYVNMTNDINGFPNPNVNITLEGIPEGMPNPDIYNVGHNYLAGTMAEFWLGGQYNFSVEDQVIQNRRPRDWNNGLIGTQVEYEMEYGIQNVIVYFRPVLPLTVTNNLEGGTSTDNFEITWQNPSPPISTTWQYGSSYNAFNYAQNSDIYKIEAITPMQSLNTTWWFRNWNDDTTNSIKSNIQVNDPTSFTAYYKGHFRSDNSSAYASNSQQKTVRDNNSYYHTVYTSIGNVWYTYSLTTDFNGNWSQEEWIGENAKNPALDFYGNNIVIVLEHNLPSTAAISKIEISWHQETGEYLIGSIEDIAFYPSSFFGNAKPVIAFTNGEIYVAYKESASSTLKFWRYYVKGTGGWETETGNIPNTTSNSLNVTLASRDNSPNDIHIAWQERTTTGTANSIKYLYSSLAGTTRDYLFYATISSKSGFIHNLNPSISYYQSGGSRCPIVSWTGKEDEGPASYTVIRPKSSTLWGSYLVTGSNVGYTVNQSVTGSDNTLIAWTENISTTKYARRINALYSCVGSELSHYGTDISLSGGNSLSQIKALVFKGTDTPPYLINKSTTDFSASCIFTEQALSKITENDTIVTFGRSGIVSINDIEFIFEIGDILVGDSIVKFIEIPDTLAYNSANELNEHTRTNSFTLTPATNFYFSNIYRVVQKSNPDTALTSTDAVNFKAELINALTDQVIGIFDDIAYNKNNLEKYANIDYEVDCSGITAGEYYLRLVTSVNGNTSYALSNIYNLNTTLAKKNFNQVNFTGSEIPATYELAQNYPNPFNPSTTIRYQIPQDGIVTIKIYDILGSEVATLVNEEKVAGKYEVNFNASSLASGVYIYKIQSGSFINSKKMILLK